MTSRASVRGTGYVDGSSSAWSELPTSNFVVFLRVEVGKRCGSTKIKARGLFKGAKVTRSPDLEGNSPDRDPNVVGEVEEVVSSNDEDTKDSVRVSWKKGGQTFIYRVGKDGKVCIT